MGIGATEDQGCFRKLFSGKQRLLFDDWLSYKIDTGVNSSVYTNRCELFYRAAINMFMFQAAALVRWIARRYRLLLFYGFQASDDSHRYFLSHWYQSSMLSLRVYKWTKCFLKFLQAALMNFKGSLILMQGSHISCC